jgi:beta-lactamase regulating signal transducer with metallopeptidase domain
LAVIKEVFVLTILEMSLSATVLILVVMIIRALALHKLPKKTFPVLWNVALCRLLVPFSVPSRLSVYTLADMLKNKVLTIDTPYIAMEADRVNNTSPAGTAVVTVSPVMALWMVGLSACALFFLFTHFRCRREYKTALPIENEPIRQWLSEHPAKRTVQIRQSDQIAAPLTYGILRPVILLPKATDWTDETTLRYILAHEFVHIRRFDTLTKLLLASVLCVHWFNPFVWAMYVLANRDIELSCDEAVIHTFGEAMKAAYALTLIRLEEKKSSLTSLVNNFSKNAIKERIVSIMKLRKNSLLNTMLSFGLVIGTAAVFATSAMASAPFAEVMLSDDASDVFIVNREAIGIDPPVITASGTASLIPLEMGINDRNGTDGTMKEVEIQEVSSEEKTILSGIEHIEGK